MLVAIAVGIAGLTNGPSSPAVADSPWYEITGDAVQTFYQDYVPQTDSQGNTLTAYSASSFLPLGIYYPEVCTSDAAKAFQWLALDNPDPPPNTTGYT